MRSTYQPRWLSTPSSSHSCSTESERENTRIACSRREYSWPRGTAHDSLQEIRRWTEETLINDETLSTKLHDSGPGRTGYNSTVFLSCLGKHYEVLHLRVRSVGASSRVAPRVAFGRSIVFGVGDYFCFP